MSYKVFHRVLKHQAVRNHRDIFTKRTLTSSNCQLSLHTSDSSPVVKTSSNEHELFWQENRSFRWDPNSGQFSFCQSNDNLLSHGISILDTLSSSQPESIAIIQRRYTDSDSSEVSVTNDW